MYHIHYALKETRHERYRPGTSLHYSNGRTSIISNEPWWHGVQTLSTRMVEEGDSRASNRLGRKQSPTICKSCEQRCGSFPHLWSKWMGQNSAVQWNALGFLSRTLVCIQQPFESRNRMHSRGCRIFPMQHRERESGPFGFRDKRLPTSPAASSHRYTGKISIATRYSCAGLIVSLVSQAYWTLHTLIHTFPFQMGPPYLEAFRISWSFSMSMRWASVHLFVFPTFDSTALPYQHVFPIRSVNLARNMLPKWRNVHATKN